MAEREQCRGRVYNLPGVHHAATPDVLSTLVETFTKLQEDAQERHPDSGLAHFKWSRSVRVVKSDPKLIVISKQNLDGTRIREEAGFEPEVSFRVGLKSTVRFYHWLFCRESDAHFQQNIPARESSLEKVPLVSEVVTLTPHERTVFS